MALARIYTTPPTPQSDVKAVAMPVTGHFEDDDASCDDFAPPRRVVLVGTDDDDDVGWSIVFAVCGVLRCRPMLLLRVAALDRRKGILVTYEWDRLAN